MAKQLTGLTVFVSGSSEVEAEKAALRVVLDDLGEVLEKTHGVTLRLIGWPDSVRPGVGADPQSVVNQQVGAEYDIYVGVLGSRFGQGTPRAASGTEEEFREALARFRQQTTSVRVLFYFKRAARNPFTLDLAQLQKVREFRDGLGAQGVLYRDFEDTAEFASLLRKHLQNLIVDEWKDGCWSQVDTGPTGLLGETIESPDSRGDAEDDKAPYASGQCTSVIEADAEEELGLIELSEEFQRAAQAATEILQRVGEHTGTIGQRFLQRTSEVNQLMEKHRQIEHVCGSREKQEHAAHAKDIVNLAAADLEQYAGDMSGDLQQFKVENRAMFESLGRAVAVQQELEMPVERLREDRKGLQDLVGILTAGRDQVTNFQASVSGLPPLTARLRKARKRTSATLGELVAQLQFSIQEARRILAQFQVNDHDTGHEP